PADRPRPTVQSFHGGRVPLELPGNGAQVLRSTAGRTRATPFIVLLAGLVALLRQYTGEDDLVVGTPVANRTRVELEGLIGFFANTLVLRCDASGDPTVAEL